MLLRNPILKASGLGSLLLAMALASCVSQEGNCDVDNGGCDPSAFCSEVTGEVTCECPSGFGGDGFSCADLDECVDGTAGCDPHATCVNTEGSFTCECPGGYSGDGLTCLDIDECSDGTAGCDPLAICTNTEGSYSCECSPGSIGDGFTCEDVVGTLDGLRWELPCLEHAADSIDCVNDPTTFTAEATLAGTAGTRYRVSLWIRGVVEEKTYLDPVLVDGHFQTGGTYNWDGWNVYSLTVSSPLQTYYLNAGASGQYICYPIDYTATIEVDAEAVVSLFADNANGNEIVNRGKDGNPIYMEGVAPWPDWYDGQFIQMDVTGIEAIASE